MTTQPKKLDAMAVVFIPCLVLAVGFWSPLPLIGFGVYWLILET